MPQTTQSTKLNIKPAIDKALSVLSDRNREILAARHGIGASGKKQTLESIGLEYGITRERVRQIEEAAYVKIRNSEKSELLLPAHKRIEEFLEQNCGAASEEYLMDSLVGEKQRAYMGILLALSDTLAKIKETDDYKLSWATTKENADAVKKLLSAVARRVEDLGKPISEEEIFNIIKEENTEELQIDRENLGVLLGVSKVIQKGPFNKWGLSSWAEVNPKGVRDKVYLVLDKHGKPLHFRELAKLIDKGPFSAKNNKNTHPQTVHNELIKDSRFVLIGRGIYALADWGYVPGTVKDVIINVLQQEGRPMNREELIKKVMDQRVVQKNTILLNLQKREHFQKVDEDLYHLA